MREDGPEEEDENEGRGESLLEADVEVGVDIDGSWAGDGAAVLFDLGA